MTALPDLELVNGSYTQPAATILYFDHTASLGGGEVALLNMVCELDRDRFTPLVVLGVEGTLQRRLLEAGVETQVLPMAAEVVHTRKDSLGVGSLLQLRAIIHSLTYTVRLAHLIRSRHVAVVHTNSLKADIIGGFAARMARTPLLWHVRDRIDADYLPAPVVRLFRALCRVLPQYIIANSEATLRTLCLPAFQHAATVYSGFASQRSSVVHDGVVEDVKTLNNSIVPPTECLTSETPVIGIIGRLSSWKGQHIFIEMAAAVHAQFPRVRFLICGSALFGEAEYEAQIRAQAQRLGLNDCLEFLGFRDDVQDVIESLDILVHASTTGEPFGQVIIEGMAAGKPVVATRGGGVPEIVADSITGRLVPMGDAAAMTEAVLGLLADPAAARAMGQAAYQRVQEKFTIKRTARQVEAIYTEMLGRSPAIKRQPPNHDRAGDDDCRAEP